MRISSLAVSFAGLVGHAKAGFYLYSGVLADSEGSTISETLAVNPKNRLNCNGIDGSVRLTASGDQPYYPWPENSFSTRNLAGFCGVPLRFQRSGNGHDYEVYDAGNGVHYGTCGQAWPEAVSCFWGTLAGTYSEDYWCPGPVCGGQGGRRSKDGEDEDSDEVVEDA